MELGKFNSEDAWNEAEYVGASDEDAAKAESSRSYLQRYDGVLTVLSARHHFADKAKSDPKFHNFVVTLEAPSGETFELKTPFCFSTMKYGDKNTLFFAATLKKLFAALGFDELGISQSTPEKLKASIATQKKYLGRWTEDGTLPKWQGLKFYTRVGYKTGSVHISKVGDQFVFVDADDKPNAFPEVKLWDGDKNDWIIDKDIVLQDPVRDVLKAKAANAGIKPTYPQILAMRGVEGVNDALLARFEDAGVITPAGALDAHSKVKADTDDVPF